MGYQCQRVRDKVPASPRELFTLLTGLLPAAGFTLLSADESNLILRAITAPSGFGVGEAVTLTVRPDGEASVLEMESRLKAGYNVLGGYRHEENFRAIRDVLWDELLDAPDGQPLRTRVAPASSGPPAAANVPPADMGAPAALGSRPGPA